MPEEPSEEVVDVDEIEVIGEPSRGAELQAVIETFLAQQRTVLTVARFMVERQHEIDNLQSRMVSDMSQRYPELGETKVRAAIEALWPESDDPPQADMGTRVELMMRSLGDDYAQGSFFMDLARATIQPPTIARTLASLLTTLMADFEVLIAHLVRLHLETDPRVLGDGEKAFSWKEVVEAESIQQFTGMVIDRTVDDLMRKSAEDWFAYLASKFKVRLPAVVSSDGLLEVIQRRHVVVHAGGIASRAYVDRVGGAEPSRKVGDHLVVDHAYLTHAADLLAEAALGLVCNSAERISEQDRFAVVQNDLTNHPYRLIQEGRFIVAAAVCKMYRNAPFEDDELRLVMQVNYWLACKLGGRLEAVREEIASWQVGALRPKYRLAKLALLGENEEALALARQIRGQDDDLPLHYWLTWPLLADVREYERSLVEDELPADTQALTVAMPETVESEDPQEESGS